MPIAYAMVLSESRYLAYGLANQQTQMYLQRRTDKCKIVQELALWKGTELP